MGAYTVVLKPDSDPLTFSDPTGGQEREYMRHMTIEAGSEEEARMIAEDREIKAYKGRLREDKEREETGGVDPLEPARRYVIVSCEPIS